MPKKLASSIAAFILLAVASFAQDPKPDQVRDFMRPKVTHAQQVLEGLAREDFDRVAKNSQQLSLLSQASQWQVLQTPDYLRLSREFRRIADRLTEAGDHQHRSAAVLAYTELTLKCVECHKYVRDQHD